MKQIFREIFIVIVCLILGYAISKYILTNIRGSDHVSSYIGHRDILREAKV